MDLGTSPETALILHWDGTRWAQVPSPGPGIDSNLVGVSAIAASNAWAVGSTNSAGQHDKTLALRWNGRRWAQVPTVSSPDTSLFSDLDAVAATSRGNAWAVGSISVGNETKSTALIERWNGSRWTRVSSPGVNGELFAVAARSASNLWVVGRTLDRPEQALALHCC